MKYYIEIDKINASISDADALKIVKEMIMNNETLRQVNGINIFITETKQKLMTRYYVSINDRNKSHSFITVDTDNLNNINEAIDVLKIKDFGLIKTHSNMCYEIQETANTILKIKLHCDESGK